MSDPGFVLIAADGEARGRITRHVGRLLSAAPRALRNADLRFVSSVGEAIACIAALPPGAIPVAAGGDGTVNLVVRALLGAGVKQRPLGVLPLGTGNVLAHALGVATTRGAVAALVRGGTRSIDLMLTGHPSASVAVMSISVGYESRFIHRMARWRRLGRPVGMAVGAVAALGSGNGGTSVTVDGERLVSPEETFCNAGLYNTAYYGFGRLVLPEAVPDDGEGEAVVHLCGRTYWGALLRGLQRPQREVPGAPRYRRWCHATLATSLPIQVDGEAVGAGSFEIRIAPRALQVIGAPSAAV